MKRVNAKKLLGKSNSKEVTPEALVEQAHVALSNMQIELAAKFFSKALQLRDDDTNVMDALADVHIQLGNRAEALTLLTSSTCLSPEINPFKWFYLAQLQSGLEAIGCYERGISIVTNQIVSLQSDDSVRMYKAQIAKAYTCMTEIYMTDLCFEDNAEGKCESFLTKAFEVDPHSLDALQAMASLRLSQCRPAEATQLIKVVLSRVKSSRDEIRRRTLADEVRGEGENKTGIDAQIKAGAVLGEEYRTESGSEDVIETDFCINTAKLLIECASHEEPQLAEEAIDLVMDLLQEDDDNTELWYLMGVAAMSLSPPDVEAARYHFEQARDMLDDLREQMTQAGEIFDQSGQYELVVEHLRMLESAPAAAALSHTVDATALLQSGLDATAAMEEEEEWSSCDEDDEAEDTTISY